MNLLIVESPLQLICAYEAISCHPNEPYTLLIRLTGRGENDAQLIKCAQMLNIEFKALKLYTSSVKLHLLMNLPLLFTLTKQKYHYFFIGSYFSSALKIISKMIRAERKFYLDDGAATIRAQQEIIATPEKFVNWFTFFSLKSVTQQEIIQHTFQHLKHENYHTESNKKYFIGQPIEYMKAISETEYIENIKNICAQQTSHLIYIPHRVENLNILKKLNQIENLQMLVLDVPVELYFLLQKKESPAEVYSFYSSAIITLACIFQNCKIFAIQPHTTHEDLDPVYTFFKTCNVTIKKSVI